MNRPPEDDDGEPLDYEQNVARIANHRQQNGLTLNGVDMDRFDPRNPDYVEPVGKDGLTMSQRAANRKRNKEAGLEVTRRPGFEKGNSYYVWKRNERNGFGGTRRLRSSKTSQGGRNGKSSKRKHAKKSRSSRRRR